MAIQTTVLLIAGLLSLPLTANAHYGGGFGGGGGGGAIDCMERAISGESDGTSTSMYAVGKTIMRRYQLGEGSICGITNAYMQFVGISLASSKPRSWRARARQIASIVFTNKLTHPFRQFRTAGMTNHKGVLIGGNVYFDTSTGQRRRSRTRYARSTHHRRARKYNIRRYQNPEFTDPFRQVASFIDPGGFR